MILRNYEVSFLVPETETVEETERRLIETLSVVTGRQPDFRHLRDIKFRSGQRVDEIAEITALQYDDEREVIS